MVSRPLRTGPKLYMERRTKGKFLDDYWDQDGG